jgi:hypothetical protein
MKMFSHLWHYGADFFLEWEVFQIKVIEKIKAHILCSVTFFLKSCRLCDNVEKRDVAGEAADNMAPAPGILDKQGHTRARTSSCPCNHTHTHMRDCTHEN